MPWLFFSSVPADCIYIVISEKGKELYLKDPRRLVPHRRWYSRVPGDRSSNSNSSKTHLGVRLLAPGNWCRERERNKVTQQITQNYLASGNWSEVLSHLLKKEEPEFKVGLIIEGIAQDVILEDEERMGQIQVMEKLRNGFRTKSIDEDLGQSENPSGSAKSRVAQFANWATLSCTSWDRYPELSSAILAWSTYPGDWPSALAAFAFDMMKKQYKQSTSDSRLW